MLGNGPLQREQRAPVVVGIELVGQVRVRVDESGKQRGVAQVDDGCAGRARCAADGLNHAVRNHHHPWRSQLAARAIEQPRGLQDVSIGLREQCVLAQRQNTDSPESS